MIRNNLPISASIAPYSNLDTYATHQAIFGKGGLREVETIGDRDSISVERRTEGMICYVTIARKWYLLHGGIENENWKDLRDVLGISLGAGNFYISVQEPSNIEFISSHSIWFNPVDRQIKFRNTGNTQWIDFVINSNLDSIIVSNTEPSVSAVSANTVWLNPSTQKIKFRNLDNTEWIELVASSTLQNGLDNIIVSNSQPTIFTNNSVWFNPVNKEIKFRDSENNQWVDYSSGFGNIDFGIF